MNFIRRLDTKTSNVDISDIDISPLEREIYQESPKSINIEKTKSFWKKLDDLYFQPKFFEKSGKLYEALGIKLFRKYFPNGGSWWTKRGQPSMVEGRKKEDLEKFILLTKILEGMHAFGFLPCYASLTAKALEYEDYAGVGVGILIMGVNLYPIMSQRYNRNKANKMLEILKQREARKI